MFEKSWKFLDVVAEVALGVLEICGGVGEGEAEGVADGDEGGHEGAEAGDGDRVGISRQGTLEHDVAHEEALGSRRRRRRRYRSNSLKSLKKNCSYDEAIAIVVLVVVSVTLKKIMGHGILTEKPSSGFALLLHILDLRSTLPRGKESEKKKQMKAEGGTGLCKFCVALLNALPPSPKKAETKGKR